MNSFQDKKSMYNGVEMQVLGFGTFRITDKQIAEESVYEAIQAGYRNIDTAAVYGNEDAVGRGIRRAMQDFGVPRSELFISTKVWNDHRGYDRTLDAFEDSLKALSWSFQIKGFSPMWGLIGGNKSWPLMKDLTHSLHFQDFFTV